MARFHLLIAEDDEDVVAYYKESFAVHKEIQISVAKNGRIAMDKIKQQRFDTIILDIKIPGADGLQVAAAIRENKTNMSTPIYIVSGSLDDTIKSICKRYNVADIIAKPFDVNMLVDSVWKKLNSKTTAASYDTRVINLFLVGAKQIFEHYFRDKISVGRPKVKPRDKPARGNLTAIIALNGNGFMGTMGVSCNQPFAERLVHGVFVDQGGMEYSDELGADTLAEICNQVAGKVKIEFGKLSLRVTIGIPQVIIGKGHRLYHKADSPVLFMPMGKDNMGCDVEFCFTATDMDISESEPTGDMEEGMILFD